MIALSDLRALPVAERLQLVEDLWDSIAVRARKARFQADPASGVAWAEAKQRIRSGRA